MRISREQMLIEMAHIASKRGTCGRLAVGAVIARDSRPISLGYVGSRSGEDHCGEGFVPCDLSKPCTRTVHAELNAIKWAERNGIDIKGADIFVTDSPCIGCAEAIAAADLYRVFYDREYRDKRGLQHLFLSDIEIHQVLPNGFQRQVTFP